MPTQINQLPIHLATAVNSQRAVAGKVTKVTSSWVACTNCSLGRITRACHLRATDSYKPSALYFGWSHVAVEKLFAGE